MCVREPEEEDSEDNVSVSKFSPVCPCNACMLCARWGMVNQGANFVCAAKTNTTGSVHVCEIFLLMCARDMQQAHVCSTQESPSFPAQVFHRAIN